MKLSDLEFAFEFVDAHSHGEAAAYVSRSTGRTYLVSPNVDEDEAELPADLESSDDYAELPRKNDLGLGQDLVFRFAGRELGELAEEVRRIFRHRGAYGRFKDLLARHHRLEAWYAFEEAETRRALVEWCETEGIEVDSGEPPDPPGGREREAG